MEAAQRFLEARERFSVDSMNWAKATGVAFDNLKLPECAEVAKPEWWNDEGLKALSARVVRAVPNYGSHCMRGDVLSGQCESWEVGLRSSAELKEAATHFEQAAALSNAPTVKAELARVAEWCRAEAM